MSKIKRYKISDIAYSMNVSKKYLFDTLKDNNIKCKDNSLNIVQVVSLLEKNREVKGTNLNKIKELHELIHACNKFDEHILELNQINKKGYKNG